MPPPKSFATNHPGLGLEDRKILIIAADHTKVKALSDILRPEGYQVADVSSSAAAIERYPHFDPDLVLLDVELPDPNVFDVCHALRNGHRNNGAPIIFITSQSDPQELVAGLTAGGIDYLFMPFRKQEIVARIRVHMLNRLRLSLLHKEDKAKNRLLCMAAHDLRNPLVSIRALTNLLRNGVVGEVAPKQRDLLDTVYDASQSMLDLVNELLDLSVLQAGELKITVAPISLAKLVAASVKLSNATAAEKDSTIIWQPGPLPEEIMLDGPKIRQVLNNLLDNAVKFSPRGSTITFATELTPDHCAITVCDQGPGIALHERQLLFKDFSRTSARPTNGESSTGLGLVICQKIMQAHGGGIQAANGPAGGAQFRISFPLHP